MTDRDRILAKQDRIEDLETTMTRMADEMEIIAQEYRDEGYPGNADTLQRWISELKETASPTPTNRRKFKTRK